MPKMQRNKVRAAVKDSVYENPNFVHASRTMAKPGAK